jgi:hypothetical protein
LGQGASQGEESVLADSGRVGEITARVGRVRSLDFLSILFGVLLLSQKYMPSKFRWAETVFLQFSNSRLVAYSDQLLAVCGKTVHVALFSHVSRVTRHGLWRLTYDVRRNRLTANDPFLSLQRDGSAVSRSGRTAVP